MKFLIFSFLFGFSLSAQEPKKDSVKDEEPEMTPDQKLLDDLRKSFFGERQMLEKYFQKGFIDKVDKMFKDSIKDFDGNIQIYQSGFSGFQAGVWKKEEKGMVLFIEGLDPKKGTFDVKLSKGNVTIKGSVERALGSYGKTMMNFSNTFPVPYGCDGERMSLENRKEGLAIVFPWSRGLKPKIPTPKPSKVPVQKDEDDITI